MIIIDEYELIEQFLSNKLEGESLAAFNERLQNDAAWAKKVEDHRQMQQLLIDRSIISTKNKLNNIHNRSIRINRIKNLTKVVLIPGVAILTIIIIYLKTQTAPENIQLNNKQAVVSVDSSIQTNDSKVEELKNKKEEKQKMVASQLKPNLEAIDSQKISHSTREAITSDTIAQVINKEAVNSKDKDSLPVTKTVKREPKKKCRLYADVIITPAKPEKGNGSLRFLETSIKNGTPPYLYSIDNEHFKNESIFENLPAGIYRPVIKDASGCVKNLDIKVIPIEKNNVESIFAPSHNETWTIPMPEGKLGILKIFSKEGNKVFERRIEEGSSLSWDGKSNAGADLLTGVYYYTISCNDGEVIKGVVTIVR